MPTGLIRTTTPIVIGTTPVGSASRVIWMAMRDIIARLQSSRMAPECQSVKLIELHNNISPPYHASSSRSHNIQQPCLDLCRGAALLYPELRRVRSCPYDF